MTTTTANGHATTALTQLLEIALELGSERDLDGILQIATQGVCRAVGCERASLFIHDTERRELYTRVVTALEIAEIRHPLDKGIVGWVATERRLLSVPVPASDARWDPGVDKRTGFKTLNILATPILAADGRLLGVLQLLNKPGGFHDLDERLVQAFASHVAVALERRRLEAAAIEALELKQALVTGHKIQAGFLPKTLPEVPGYEIAAWWQPAEFVSGDYYDWLALAEGRVGFAVGDVSGHGLAAALIMATVRAMAHVLARTAGDVHEFVETLRASLTPDLQDGRFLTCCFVVVDPVTHRVDWANGGHAPAYHYRAASREAIRLFPTVMPLGFPEIKLPHATAEARLEPGDLVFLGTDGIIELRSPADEMYGSARLEALIDRHAGSTAAEIVAAIRDDVLGFHGDANLPDDATVLIVKRTA
jgi:phosphoserine phosphatase RsbU/P